MKNFFIIIITLAFSQIIGAGCKKEAEPKTEKVYVAGIMLQHNITYIASLWEDGGQSYLSDGHCLSDGYYSLFVNETGSFVTGRTSVNEEIFFGHYWINRNSRTIGDGKGTLNMVNAMVENNGDIYIAGKTKKSADLVTVATYWKNEVPVYLSTNQTSSTAIAISIQGSDIYVAGNETISENGTTSQYATYWKNGQAFHVSRGHTEANSLCLNGSDVYMAGNILGENGQPSIAVYWRNGNEIQLTDGKLYACARSIFIYQNDVYVAGTTTDKKTQKLVATYWKNGTPVYLTDAKTDARANSIFVTDLAVYVAGETSSEPDRWVATYWKNGAPHYLSDDSTISSAQSIFVK